jgi:bifunctional NMN adenylyltransferase/nudix hydrolase
MYEYDILVFVGRFQPFHIGHHKTIQKALNQSKYVFIGIGSAEKPRDSRNPFTFEERKSLILEHFTGDTRDRLLVYDLPDETYNDDLWADKLRENVVGVNHTFWAMDYLPKINESKIGIIGNKRDHTSFYFDLFPEWTHVDGVDFINDINATDIRQAYFRGSKPLESWLTTQTIEFLNQFKTNNAIEYGKLVAEQSYVEQYKESWQSEGTQKYGGPIHHTADTVVVCKGHVLLVKRRSYPGMGTYAFPGGYVNFKERIEDSAIRELKEETKIDVPPGKLRGSIVEHKTFDDPERSVRGRVITNAYFINLKDEKQLPKIKGSSDAEKAEWVPLYEFYNMQSVMFEDHFHIGKYFLRGR